MSAIPAYPYSHDLLRREDMLAVMDCRGSHLCGYCAFRDEEIPAHWRGNYDAPGLQFLSVHGPWRSTGLEYEPETGWFVREAGEGRYLAVAAVRSTHRSREEIEANARLIAAAPDLLEACQELIDVIDSVDGEEEYSKEEWAALGGAKLHAEDRIRAAIARATGEIA
jgi:hypothetical protein